MELLTNHSSVGFIKDWLELFHGYLLISSLWHPFGLWTVHNDTGSKINSTFDAISIPYCGVLSAIPTNSRTARHIQCIKDELTIIKLCYQSHNRYSRYQCSKIEPFMASYQAIELKMNYTKIIIVL